MIFLGLGSTFYYKFNYIDNRKFIKSIGSAVMKLQFDAEKMSIKDRDNSIINQLKDMEKSGAI